MAFSPSPQTAARTSHDRPGGARRHLLIAIATLTVVAAMLPLAPAALAAGNQGIQLDGVDDAIHLGPGTSARPLGATQFTLEMWFKRTGTGVDRVDRDPVASPRSIPLITKGRSEADGTDAGYELLPRHRRSRPADALARGRLREHPAASANNNPVVGTTTVITQNVWHHAAATFNGSQLCLYLDGVLDGTCLATTQTPRSDSIQPPAIGTAADSTGARAAGFFAGADRRGPDLERRPDPGADPGVDERRGHLARHRTSSAVGRMNEGSGTTVANTGRVGERQRHGRRRRRRWVAGAPALDPPPRPVATTAVAPRRRRRRRSASGTRLGVAARRDAVHARAVVQAHRDAGAAPPPGRGGVTVDRSR